MSNKSLANIFLSIVCLTIVSHASAQDNSILLFVSHEQTYYSEFIIMHQALTAAGYTVDVRSASAMNASTYMVPAGTTIEATANTLTGSSYTEFTTLFQNLFNATLNPALNTAVRDRTACIRDLRFSSVFTSPSSQPTNSGISSSGRFTAGFRVPVSGTRMPIRPLLSVLR